MAAQHCAISGEATSHPVVITTTGYVCDRDLLDKHVKQEGHVCPVTKRAFDPSKDVVEIRASPAFRPRTTPASSIPGLLGLLQNEWDALMLEVHDLRTAYQACRQELSQTLYMHDAACRVIARLVRERDELRAQIVDKSGASLPAAPAAADDATKKRARDGAGAAPSAPPAQSSGADATKRARAGITSDVIDKMQARAAALSKTRKKRPLPEGLASPESLGTFALAGKFPLHTASGPTRGITTMDVDPASGVVLTGGADGKLKIFDAHERMAKSDAIKAHGKKVTKAKFLGDGCGLLGTCSTGDKTCKIWRRSAEGKSQAKPFAYDCVHRLDGAHAASEGGSGEVFDLAMQAAGEHVVSFGRREWVFHDVAEGLALATVKASDDTTFTAGGLHPDGLILATGTATGPALIWDIKQQKSVCAFEGHAGPIHAISFSENGYYLATTGGRGDGAEDSVRVWDLRKLKAVHTMATPYAKPKTPVVATFDASGAYLAVGAGGRVDVHGTKQEWRAQATFDDVVAKEPKGVSAMGFGPLAQFVAVASAADHNLRIYTSTKGEA